MRHLISTLTILLFFIWILPLGYFIKPTQEKTVCDGQRGMCMCTVFMAKKVSHNPGKMILAAATQGASKEAPSSGGASNYYVSTIHIISSMNIKAVQWESPIHLSSLLFIHTIESVPRF